MTIETLAEQYRLHVSRDSCHDKIIQGRRGYLYIDAGKVCAMWIDAPVTMDRLRGLGAKVWVGDFTLDLKRPSRPRRLRDAKVTNIPADKVPLAIRLTGCRRGPEMTEEQREARRSILAQAQATHPERFKKKETS